MFLLTKIYNIKSTYKKKLNRTSNYDFIIKDIYFKQVFFSIKTSHIFKHNFRYF